MSPEHARRLVWTLLPGLVLTAAGLVLFGKMLDDVREGDDLAAVDQAVLDWLVAHRSPWLTSVLAAITFVSGPVVLPILVLLACVVWWWVRREWWRPSVLAAAMVGSTALGLLVKDLVNRPRPPAETMQVPGAEHTASFPSGHTLGTATLLLVAGYLVCSRRRSAAWTVAWVVAAVAGTALVAVSRLYLGYHFLTDVIASIGLAVAVLGIVSIVDRWHTGPPPNRTSARAPAVVAGDG
ncbi:phosphatase PAP2 family protein [Cellulomonas edaphi]|uniref:Phosphatase PAP2 family protein n=1 Tax=Cellulomonas edaphi TaxID=3053468 RepID=A0ABT7SAG0_9CELL|nr:phosphatase PAP2 family protein [Cellulomons edaphi]MDM7832601.1 phosphatase PAP2 family protein [Cellulomons edaphi]